MGIAQFKIRANGAGMLLAAAITLCAGVPQALAELRVVRANGQPVPEGAAQVVLNVQTGGWEVSLMQLYSPWSDTVFEIRGNAGEVIDKVEVLVDGPAAGSPVVVRVLGESPGYVRSVGSVIQKGTAETILNRVQVLEDVGRIEVEAIGDVFAGRDVIGPVVATTGDNSVRGVTSVQAGRHILGDVLAENGRILLVYSSGGDIGSAAKQVNIRAKHAVYQVEAKDVYANINARVNGGSGGFFALVCDKFAGSLSAERLMANQYIPLNGLILIRQQFAGAITFGKSLTNPPAQYIQLPVTGLTGQIVINADNAAGATWNVPVRIGAQGDPNQIVLTGPTYAHLPQNLGGGSVGLVPFRLHGSACVPAQGAEVAHGGNGSPLKVQLRHYGPVTLSGSAPVSIERRPRGSSQAFGPTSAGDFIATVALNDPNVLEVTAAVGKPGFVAGYEYRIRATSQLRCATTGSPAVAWGTDYFFTVTTPACPGDVNADRVVNVSDLLIVISFWGTNAGSQPLADTNSDGVVNVTDLLTVISRWGMCPG